MRLPSVIRMNYVGIGTAKKLARLRANALAAELPPAAGPSTRARLRSHVQYRVFWELMSGALRPADASTWRPRPDELGAIIGESHE